MPAKAPSGISPSCHPGKKVETARSPTAKSSHALAHRQHLAGAARHGDAALQGDAADDHEVIVVVQRTGADADTVARELSFAAERL
jgi:hypothetical protein